MNSRLSLKIFFSISLSIHLFLFSVVSILNPEFKIGPLLPLNLEVSLILPVLPTTPPSPQSISKNIHLRESKPLPIGNGTWDRGDKKEQKAVREIVPTAMSRSLASDLDSIIWSDEKPFPLQEESQKNSSETEDLSIPPTPSYSEKMKGTPSPPTDSQEASLIISKLEPSLDGNAFFAQPRYAENPKPTYPEEARKNGYEGEVLLKVEVLANGRVRQVEVKKSSGYETLDRSALTTVRQWKFIPANRGNGAVPCWVNIPIKFQLQ